jgi:hypothetical protein
LNEGIGKITVSYNGITNESGNITVNERVNPPPAQPDQPTLVVIGGEQINITWPENTESDLKEYVIQRSENATGPWTNISIISAGNNSFSDSELVPGTTYYYRIIAVDTEGNPSNASQVTSATTEKKINGNGGDDFPWIIVIIIIVVVLLLIFLLIFIIKKKQGV